VIAVLCLVSQALPSFPSACQVSFYSAAMKPSLLLALAAGASAYAAALSGIQERQSNWTVGQEVQTSSGPVTGHAAKNQSEVSEYLGIPYGQPPIGDLRFAAPVKFAGNASLNGTSYVSIPFHHYQKHC